MRPARLAAVLLIVFGAVALAYPGLTYKTRDKVVDLGPVQVTAEHEHHIPLWPFAGGAAVVAGVALLVVKRSG